MTGYTCVQCGRRARTVFGVWLHTYFGGWLCDMLKAGREHG